MNADPVAQERLFPEFGSDTPPPGAPAVDADPFSLDFFADPYPTHALLRDAGPFVWLSRYGIGAVARYQQVREVLTDWQTFSSARGVGMADFERHGRFRLPSIILEVDPPQHSRARNALNKVLSPGVMRGLRERFAEARAARNYPVGNVEAGREYIEKYVPFVHYVERLYQSATTNAPGHEAEADTAAQHEE